jgi:hypothetical protein
MRIFLTVFISVLTIINSIAGNKISEKEKNEIRQLLQKQVEAWNEGDLEKFMETYWKSEELSFVGSRGPTYGWKATLDSYKKGYPDKGAMGELELNILKIAKIDKKTILVIGRFDLAREIGDLGGYYTLVIQKFGKEWYIISDHSSAEK